MSAAISESVTIEDLELARARLAGIVTPTPLIHSATLSRMLGAEIYLKPENLQKTGSFKIRGAYNRIAALSPAEAALCVQILPPRTGPSRQPMCWTCWPHEAGKRDD